MLCTFLTFGSPLFLRIYLLRLPTPSCVDIEDQRLAELGQVMGWEYNKDASSKIEGDNQLLLSEQFFQI
jgi:hypothetical protein